MSGLSPGRSCWAHPPPEYTGLSNGLVVPSGINIWYCVSNCLESAPAPPAWFWSPVQYDGLAYVAGAFVKTLPHGLLNAKGFPLSRVSMNAGSYTYT